MDATVYLAAAVLALLAGALGGTVAGQRRSAWPAALLLGALGAAGAALLTLAGGAALARIVAAAALLVLALGAVARPVGDRLATWRVWRWSAPEPLGVLVVIALGGLAPGVLGWAVLLGGYLIGIALPRRTVRRARQVRPLGGVVAGLLAVALLGGGFDVPAAAPPTAPPGPPRAAPAPPTPTLSGLTQPGNEALSECTSGAPGLQRCGQAPELARTGWLNTPDGRPERLDALRGKVVLLDFWSYSCVNCQRSVRHLADWDRRYADAGLRILGVHAARFGFERQRANVAAQVRALGLRYPVAVDGTKTIWNQYRNRVWPTSFLIDANGTVRHLQIGEGGYANTETQLRTLLRAADPGVTLPPPSTLPDGTPRGRQGGNYLNYFEVRGYAGTPLVQGRPARYRYGRPVQEPGVSLDGTWTVTGERFETGQDARLSLRYRARTVHLVLGGRGNFQTTVDGGPSVRTDVAGAPRLYRVIADTETHTGRVEFTLSPGLQVYEVITE